MKLPQKKKRLVDKRKGGQRGEGDSCPLQECSLATQKHRQCYSFQRKQRQNSALISSVMSREVPGHAHSSLNTRRPSSLSTHKPVITRKPSLLLLLIILIRILISTIATTLSFISHCLSHLAPTHTKKKKIKKKHPTHLRVSQTGLYLLTALSYPCEVKNAFSNFSHARLSLVKSPLHSTDLDSRNGKPLPSNKRKILRFTAF